MRTGSGLSVGLGTIEQRTFHFVHLMPGSGILSAPYVSDIGHGKQEFPFFILHRHIRRAGRQVAGLLEGTSIDHLRKKTR
jgi:hypothetical protein